MKYLMFLIICLFELIIANVSDDRVADTIYLKKDSVFFAQIVSIDSFAIYLSNDKVIGLKVVDSLITQNDTVASLLQKVFPNIIIYRRETFSSVSFANVTVPSRMKGDIKTLKDFSCFLYYYRHDERANLEIQCSFLVDGISNVVFQLAYSSSVTPGNEEMLILRLQYLGENYEQKHMSQAFIGVGYSQTLDDYRARVMLNVGEKRVYSSNAGLSLGTVIFISPYIEKKIINNHVRISIGSHLYLKKIPAHVKSQFYTFNIGLGYGF